MALSVADYEVYCAGDRCDNCVLGLGETRAGAAKELLQHHGWRIRGGKWFCPKCYVSTRQERQAIADTPAGTAMAIGHSPGSGVEGKE